LALLADLGHALDGAAELLRIGRIGGVAGLLQLAGIGLGRAGLGHGFFVARIAADQACVVAEGLLVGVIGAELGRHLLGRAIDVFGGRDFGDLARPAATGLDAEQVERVAAVLVADLALAPARLVPGLADHVVGRDAALAGHALRRAGVRRHEVVAPLGSRCIGIDRLRSLAAAAAPGAVAAHIAPGIAAQAQGGRHGNFGVLGGVDPHAARQLLADGIGEAAGLARHGHRELLIQQSVLRLPCALSSRPDFMVASRMLLIISRMNSDSSCLAVSRAAWGLFSPAAVLSALSERASTASALLAARDEEWGNDVLISPPARRPWRLRP
jgi:hypothetical protein